MTRKPSPPRLSWLLFVLCATLGAFWTAAALSKGLSLLDTGSQTASPASWSEGFPVPLQFAVVGAELLIGLWLLFGHRVRGLIAAIVLLGAFSMALLLAPPASDQSCGCGIIAKVLPFDPIARNTVLAGLHAIVLALVAQPGPHTDRPTVHPAYAAMPQSSAPSSRASSS